MKSKEQKKTEAETRLKEHEKLTTEEKIAKLDAKFGVDTGAKRERARILAGVER